MTEGVVSFWADLSATYGANGLVFIIVTLVIAAFLKGLTGMGFSTVAVTLLTATIGIRNAIPLLLLPSLASNFLLMHGAGHFRETIHRFKALYLLAPLGIFFGLNLLVRFDEAVLEAFLGGVLLFYCAFAYLKPQFYLKPLLEKILAGPVGFLTGLLNGMTGAQILPVGPYLLSLPLSANQTVQALNCSFTISSLALVLGLIYTGDFKGQTLFLSIPTIALTYVGVRLGEKVRFHISPDHFRRAVLLLMSALGLIFIARLAFHG